jgi:hypothetical protein
MPAVEIALLKPPRHYQALDDEHTRLAEQSSSQQQDQQAQVSRQPEANPAQPEPQPTRPPEVRAPSPGWTDSPRMDMQQAAATNYNNWANVNAAERQSAQPDVAIGMGEKAQQRDKAEEKLIGKERIAANLQAAKEARPQKGPDRDASPPETAQTERLSGSKARLSANLKAAKESSKETDQSRDTSRSR